jgi:hypothetical protein
MRQMLPSNSSKRARFSSSRSSSRDLVAGLVCTFALFKGLRGLVRRLRKIEKLKSAAVPTVV